MIEKMTDEEAKRILEQRARLARRPLKPIDYVVLAGAAISFGAAFKFFSALEENKNEKGRQL